MKSMISSGNRTILKIENDVNDFSKKVIINNELCEKNSSDITKINTITNNIIVYWNS